MTKADHAAWVALAKKSSFAEFVKKSTDWTKVN